MKKTIFIILLTVSLSSFSQSKSDINRAAHLLNRLSYGPRPNEVEILAKSGQKGIDAWISEQLHPEKMADTAVDLKLKKIPSLLMSNEQRLHKYVRKNKIEKLSKADQMQAEAPNLILGDLISQKLIRAVESKKQLQEVMTAFWFNHFNVDFRKGVVKHYITSYERDAIRPFVFGKFSEMLKATAKDPAMLFYLDAFLSVKDNMDTSKVKNKMKAGLNENYARELMELHTLGVDGGYNQNDIREVARAFSGWTIAKPQFKGTFLFQKYTHDMGSKKVMDLVIPAGGGIEDAEKVLDYLAHHPSTAKFIARKLCVKFISDDPPQSAIDKVSEEFIKTKGDLRAVYLKLFSLPEFWSEKSMNAKIKTPFEFAVSAVRILDGKIEPFEKFKRNALVDSMDKMGEMVYRCQPPTGYKATADFWVNPAALVYRIQLGLQLANGKVGSVETDLAEIKTRLNKNKDLSSALDQLNHQFLQDRISSTVEKKIVAQLREISADLKDEKTYVTETKEAIPSEQLIGLVLGSPEFQRR